MRACNVSSGQSVPIYANFTFETAKQKTEETGLLDSGATHNFIDVRTVLRLGVGTRRLEEARTVTNVDGTENQSGQITRYANLQLTYNDTTKNTPFYVTNLGRDRILLGLPWFKEFEPTIDWKGGKQKGTMTMKTTSRVAQINATQATTWAIENEKNKTRLSEDSVPEQYKEYSDVFSEQKAKRFPPDREENHEIEFTSDVPKFFEAKVYQMPHKQVTFLRKWLDEELAKGFIRPSKSPYPSPTFLIDKKNGDYRVVQDYIKLNSFTKPDKHPLPLIADLINQLHGKTLFTKFDIRMGYNNIRIKEGDQEKAAFTTPLGQYEPMVMNFGLRNAPATFVRAMIRVFRTLQNEYPGELLVYMDDILIATTNDVDRHRQIVKKVLKIMRKESFFLRAAKCEFEQTTVEYLGLVLDHDTVKPDPTKTAGLKAWPRTLKTVREVRSTLGLLNYHRAFVPGFSHIVKPLTTLLKKDTPFNWTPACTNALDRVIHILTTEPVLTHPDPEKPFELEVDASDYATGAILFQRDDRGKPKPLGFHSKTLSKEEMNYDIYDKELTALDRGLDEWRHLILGQPTTVHTDHANLTYYRKPQKLTPRAKRAVARIMQYDITIKHKPGILNKADALSRRPDYPHKPDETEETAFPDHMFINAASIDLTLPSLMAAQHDHRSYLQNLTKTYSLSYNGHCWYHNLTQLVVPEDNELRRGVISLFHDSTTAGHPGTLRTRQAIEKDFWWPTLRTDVQDYVKGCATCQSTKPRTTQPKPPLHPITPENYQTPFGTIALDFITKLPKCKEHDTILTITDHDCSKATLFFPCSETITAEDVATLYAKHVFPHYGIPRKVISDRDPRFTGQFTTDLCKQLGIKQNLSTAYHPQTDGQSEQSNQWLEQYLRIFGDYAQNDWADWLPLAQFVHNTWMNKTTKQSPFNLLIGGLPTSHYPMTKPMLTDDKRMDRIHQMRSRAQEAITKAQDVMKRKRGTNYKPFNVNDRVWLEATNLRTTHPTAKLAPKRLGPFKILNKISNVVYQLELPPQWKIHNVFHTTLLTPYTETDLHGPNYLQPPPDIIEGEPEFEVERILKSRRVGKNKSLQYLIRWKGYSQAHDSWEPAKQVHAPELVKQYLMTQKGDRQSSQQSSSAINYQAVSAIPRRPSPLSHPRAYSSHPEERYSKQGTGTLGVSKSGKRTPGLPIIRTKSDKRIGFSPNDKRKSELTSRTNNSFAPLLHINNITMTSNQETNNNEDFRIISFAPPTTVEDEEPIALTDGNPPLMSNSELGRDLLRGVLLAEHARIHASPPESEGQTLNPSPTPTEDDTPNYPYRPFLGDKEDDIPTDVHARPYLAALTNRANGDPRLLGTEGANAPIYDEGPLNALPRPWIGEEEDQGVLRYNIGEDAYLDPDFLRAMGTTEDRGLAAEGLRLVQLEGEFRYLKHWEKKLGERERANIVERGELIRKQTEATKRQNEVYERLRGARAAARLGRLLPYHNGRRGLSVSSPGQPYSHPNEEERRQASRECYWCGDRSLLYGHHGRDCRNPHIRCARLSRGRCVVPPHHSEYHSHLLNTNACPYNGDHAGQILRGDHA